MARWAARLAAAGALLVIGGPVLYRVGAVGLAVGLLGVPLGALLALVALVLSAIVLVGGRPTPSGRGVVLGACALSALTGLGPVLLVAPGLRAPAIHDVTTDPDDPPRFEAIVPLRADAPNSLEYPPDTAAAQRDGYPELATMTLSADPAAVVERARSVATDLGWTVVAADPTTGRVEASDTTFWFGFVDDVVVRIRPASGGSEVDVRSVSRVGGGDLGANAARIRRFLERLRAGV